MLVARVILSGFQAFGPHAPFDRGLENQQQPTDKRQKANNRQEAINRRQTNTQQEQQTTKNQPTSPHITT